MFTHLSNNLGWNDTAGRTFTFTKTKRFTTPAVSIYLLINVNSTGCSP